jgi:hypothetical protein
MEDRTQTEKQADEVDRIRFDQGRRMKKTQTDRQTGRQTDRQADR